MKKNRFLALLLAAVMLLGLLAGCSGDDNGGNGNSASPNGGSNGGGNAASVTLNVVTSYGGDDGNRKNYEAAVKAYEEATGNKVQDASATSNEEWKAKVLTDFETGTEPDVLFFFTNADAEPFIQAGKVVDIATIHAEYPDYATNMRDSMLAVASDGKNYAVPSSGFWENMFVNTKVLADCGPDYTWDQFLADCQTIKDKGYTPIACSLFEVPHYWFEFCVMNNGTLANHLDSPDKREAAVKFVEMLTSDETLSTFVTTEVTALKNGASPAGLNELQQSAADANAAITGVVGAVQDTITSEAKTDLFGNVQNVVTGKMSAEDAVTSAIALN